MSPVPTMRVRWAPMILGAIVAPAIVRVMKTPASARTQKVRVSVGWSTASPVMSPIESGITNAPTVTDVMMSRPIVRAAIRDRSSRVYRPLRAKMGMQHATIRSATGRSWMRPIWSGWRIDAPNAAMLRLRHSTTTSSSTITAPRRRCALGRSDAPRAVPAP